MRPLVLLFLAACAAAKPVVVDKVVPVEVRVPCAAAAPPAWVPVPAAIECVKGKICYAPGDYANLIADVGALRSWAASTWDLCRRSAP